MVNSWDWVWVGVSNVGGGVKVVSCSVFIASFDSMTFVGRYFVGNILTKLVAVLVVVVVVVVSIVFMLLVNITGLVS